MTLNDGPILKGRFLKKDSNLQEIVKLTEFSLEEIRESPAIACDNLDGSIVHVALHTKEEINEAVGSVEALTKDLRGDNLPLILRPLNFTEDWEKQRQRSNIKRRSGIDDEDYDYELEMEIQKEEQAKAEAAAVESPEPPPTEEGGQESEENPLVIKSESDSMEEAIAEAAVNAPSDIHQVPSSLASSPDVGQSQEEASAQPHSAPASTDLSSLAATNIDNHEDISEKHEVSAAAENAEATNQPDTTEEVATQAASTAEQEELLEQERSKTREIVQQVESVISELEGLKKDVLKSVQSNFQELSQAVAESILRKEFKVHPENFAQVIEKAIEEAVTDDQFKVLLHPSTFNTLKEMNIESLDSHMEASDQIKEGDFKIESKLSVVDGNLAKLVSELIENSDIDLFDSESEDKAG